MKTILTKNKLIVSNFLLLMLSCSNATKVETGSAETHISETATSTEKSSITVEPLQKTANESCSSQSLPQKIRIVKENDNFKYSKLFFVLNEKHQRVAKIFESPFVPGEFKVTDMSDALMAQGKKSTTGGSADIVVLDCQGTEIGRIHRDIENSFLTADISFQIFSRLNNVSFLTQKEAEDSKIFKLKSVDKLTLGFLRIERNEKTYEAEIDQNVSGEEQYLVLAALRAYAVW